MSDIGAGSLWRLASVIRSKSDSGGKRLGATYVSTDHDGTKWVMLDGSDEIVPVTGTVTSSMVEGQKVEVEVRDGRLNILGNSTDPAAGSSGLSKVQTTVTKVEETVQSVRTELVEADRVQAREIAAERARIGELETDTAKIHDLTADQLSAATAYVATLTTNNITAESLTADHATIGTINADYLKAADMQAEQARVGTLLAGKADVTDLTAATARIGDLEADHVSVSDFEAEQANIDNLQAATADISTIRANSAKVANLTAAQLEADHATIGTLDTTYMHADMSNSDVAWIENGTIKNGAISSAMINDVSANKLTAGTINGSVINVTNLNADNITTGTINGQRIGEGSLSLDKLSDDVYTESEVNNIVDGLNDRIDGAIETFTGTTVPTLNNSPASSWNTTKLRDEHVGDVYYVVNSQSQQNGYCYRFTKSGSTYSWQLIKDSDVTAALSRLTTAEGKITTFDSDISKLKTDTGTLTTKTESLETRMSDAEEDILDKVDTTTFNEVSDTVDQHSQTISQHTTAISNKADSSTVTAVTNRVSKNEQDISGINTTIGELQTTVESKADGSTVSTISNKLNTVSDTVDGHTQSISSITSTQTTMQGKLDKTLVETTQLWFSKANTTAPNKPTVKVTSTSTGGNAWTTKVPTYNENYKYYFYCMQYIAADGTVTWSDVVHDQATTEAQNVARTASADLTEFHQEYATFKQTVNEFESTVGETYATKTDVDGKISTEVANRNSAIQQSADAIALTVSKSYLQTQSRGEQLITNGSGLMGDNTNFSSWRFDGSVSNNSPGSFTRDVGWTTIMTDELFAVDPSKEYVAEFDVYASGSGALPKMFAMLSMYDADKKLMQVQHCSYIIGSTTTLAREVKNGDTKIYLTSAAGFTDTSSVPTHQRALIFWNYTNSFGYTYPPETYSRNIAYNAAGLWDVGAVDKTNNVITLKSAWTYGTYPAGTSVSQNSNGNNYAYFWYVTSNFPVDVWTHAKGTYHGFQTGVANAFGKFYPGTAYCKVGWLWNYQNDTSNPQKQLWITNVSVKERVATSDDLNQLKAQYGTCSTAAGTSAKVVSLADFSLYIGATISVRFNSGNTVASPTLNVNNTGAKAVMVNGSATPTADQCKWNAYATCQFTYDGTYWRYVGSDQEAVRIVSAEASIAINADNIESKVSKDGVISSINQSAESVQIHANRVNIEGATIFSSGRLSTTNLNNAYDAKGAASTAESNAKSYAESQANAVQANLDNLEIGGRNLIRNTNQGFTGISVSRGNGTFILSEIDIESGRKGLRVDISTPSTSWSYVSVDISHIARDMMIGDPGGRYAVSFNIRSDGSDGETSGNDAVSVVNGSAQNSIVIGGVYYKYTADDVGSWKRIQRVLTVVDNPVLSQQVLYIGIANLQKNATYIELKDFKLEKGNRATDWTPAPEDIEANAVKRTQRIWYRSNSATAPSTPGTASANWVTKADDGNDAWTKMHVAISSTHKYVYTCEQYELASGTVGYTMVLRDNTITVIDGGNIITGTVSANAVNASSGTFDTANIPDLSAAKITSGNIAADRIKANVISAINSLTAGQIDADRINASQLSIGQSQVTDLTSDLADAKKHTQVIVSATNVNYAANTCNLTARLYVDGTLQTSTSLKWQWYRDGTAQDSQQTAATGTLSVTSSLGLAHRYACKCTF